MVPASGMSREGASPHAAMKISRSVIDVRISLSFSLPHVGSRTAPILSTHRAYGCLCLSTIAMASIAVVLGVGI